MTAAQLCVTQYEAEVGMLRDLLAGKDFIKVRGWWGAVGARLAVGLCAGWLACRPGHGRGWARLCRQPDRQRALIGTVL